MKVLLCQHGLDKPFSGGIGSFKLYVLVASHVSLHAIVLVAILLVVPMNADRPLLTAPCQIEQHLSLGGQDQAAEVLITFLFRYGRIPDTTRGEVDGRIRTLLRQETVVSTVGPGLSKGMADMSSVFQLDNSIRVFQACYFVLRRKLQKPNTDPHNSILGHVVDGQWLRGERSESRRKIPAVHSNNQNCQRFSNSCAIPGLPANWRSNERPRLVPSPAPARKSLDKGGKRKQSDNTAQTFDADGEVKRPKALYRVDGRSGFKADSLSSSSGNIYKKTT